MLELVNHEVGIYFVGGLFSIEGVLVFTFSLAVANVYFLSVYVSVRAHCFSRILTFVDDTSLDAAARLLLHFIGYQLMLIIVISIASVPKPHTGSNAPNAQPAPDPPVVPALDIVLISLLDLDLVLVLVLLLMYGLGWGVMRSIISQRLCQLLFLELLLFVEGVLELGRNTG